MSQRKKKSSGQKSRARRRQERTVGASYTSARAGTAHRHPGPDLGTVDGRQFGVGRQADMAPVSALLGAGSARCRPCQRTLADAVLASDRLLIACLAGAVFSTLPPPASAASPVTHRFWAVARTSARPGGAEKVLAFIEELGEVELEQLLEDAVDLWVGMAAGPDGLAELLEHSAAAEHESGQHREEPSVAAENATGQAHQEYEEAAGRFAGFSCAYLVAAGVEEFLSVAEQRSLVEHAEAGVRPGREPVQCHLCDQVVDVRTEREVHLGLVSRTTPQQELLMPVWTHARCGRARVWTWPGLAAARHARGLPVDPADLPAPQPVGGQQEREEDVTLFSLAQLADGLHPAVIIQPGAAHEHGVQGHLADRLSEGLRKVDLTGAVPPPRVPWQLRMEAGRLVRLTISGAGVWYEQPGGHATTEKWCKAARATWRALLLVVPAGTLDLEGDPDGQRALGRAARAGHVLGGLVEIRGSLS